MSSEALQIRRSSLGTCSAAAVFCALFFPTFVNAQSVVVVNQRQPFNTTFFDDCSGEDIQVVAEDHVVVIQKVGKDGIPYWEESINTHGTVLGLTSGNEYVYNETIRFKRPAEPGPECGFAIEFSTKLRLISKGSHPDLFVKYFLQLEISPSCVPTMTEQFESACKE